jgi:hypothetical protein
MRTNEQTDMMKLIVSFRNFASAPKNRKRYETTRSPNLIRDHGICQEGPRKTNSLVRIRLGFEPDTFRIHVKSIIARVKFVTFWRPPTYKKKAGRKYCSLVTAKALCLTRRNKQINRGTLWGVTLTTPPPFFCHVFGLNIGSNHTVRQPSTGVLTEECKAVVSDTLTS